MIYILEGWKMYPALPCVTYWLPPIISTVFSMYLDASRWSYVDPYSG